VLDRVGDTWSLLVIINLQEKPVRFNALKRGIEGISQRMLTVTLRSLERDGLIRRTVRPTTPPEVEYALTELGQSIAVPIGALGCGPRKIAVRSGLRAPHSILPADLAGNGMQRAAACPIVAATKTRTPQ
jgi:DNA-binding HxlR family transcriptional regulator